MYFPKSKCCLQSLKQTLIARNGALAALTGFGASTSGSPHEKHPLSLPEGTPQTAPTHHFELRLGFLGFSYLCEF